MDASLFAGCELVATAATWTLYRDGDAMLIVRFHGDIDDDASHAWRDAAQRHLDSRGFPRFGFVAPTEGHATSSLASRMRTVAFLRRCAQRFERVVILGDANSNFVIKTIMRAAGLPNVDLVDVADAPALFASLR